MEKQDAYTTVRIWTSTLKLLRLIAAIKGERMVAILDRLVRREYERVRADEAGK